MKRLLPVALVLLAAGCGGGSSTPTQTAVPATRAAAPAEAATPLPALQRVQVGGKRVVFTFSRPVAHARGRFVQALHTDVSDTVVPVAGGALLVMRFEPATDRGYTGAAKVTAKGPVLEVVRGGDVAGLLTWAIGLDTERTFHVAHRGATVVVTFGL